MKDWLVGRVLGKYELVKPIGFGSFANIYEAVHVHLRVPFAIKVLHPAFTSHEEVVKRFFREGQAASQLQHENVVFIADFDVEEDVGPYIVMEYLEGETLKGHIARHGALKIEQVGEISRQICQALSLAHSKGIIHRDLKPENIFLVPRGAGRHLVKILDFGIAHLADCGESITGARLLGTPVYMAPEQFRGETHSTSLDIYSFGVLLYEMFMGKPPFKGQNVQQLGIEHLLIPAPELPEEFPEALRKIVARLLAKKPIERPSSMEEVWSILAPAIDPNHAFTHWHQEAIDPITAARLMGETPSSAPTQKAEHPTDTVIESLEDYDFKATASASVNDLGNAEHADTEREHAPLHLHEEDEDEGTVRVRKEDLAPNNSTTSKNNPPEVRDFPTSKHPLPGLSLRSNRGQSDTADEGAGSPGMTMDQSAELEPLPPIDAPDTTVVPANGAENFMEAFADFATQASNATFGEGKTEIRGIPPKAPFPQLGGGIRPTGPILPPSTPPPMASSGPLHPTPSGLGAFPASTSKKGPPRQLFGFPIPHMGAKEKRLLVALWLGVLLVVASVFYFIFSSIPEKKVKKPQKPRSAQTAPITPRPKAPKDAQDDALLQEIQIQSIPSGARVYENGKKLPGVTPMIIKRPLHSTLQFTFMKNGYRTGQRSHTVKDFGRHIVQYTFRQ